MASAEPIDTSADPVIGSTLGGYHVTRKIAQGGMGAVYEATHVELGRRAAVKVLLPELTSQADAASRFFNEAKAVSLVSHPSLVTIYEHGKSANGEAYIVLEFVDGESMRHRLEKRYLGHSAVGFVRQMASALEATHNRRIIHRDLKPENIMLTRDDEAPGGERAKILDFGIAKLLPDGASPDERRSLKTRTGTLIGTPTYMSPEQCRASEPVNEKTDVYSLGVIFYELLYGEPPFVSDSAGELFALQMFAPPPLLQDRVKGLSPKIAALIHRMLAKKPAERPSMSELVTELRAIGDSGLQDGERAARPSELAKTASGAAVEGPDTAALIRLHITSNTEKNGRGEQLQPPSRSRIVALAISGGVLCVALVTGVVLWRGHEHPAGQRPTPAVMTSVAPPDAGAAVKPPAPQSPPVTTPPTVATPPAVAKKDGAGQKPPRGRRSGSHNKKDDRYQIDFWK